MKKTVPIIKVKAVVTPAQLDDIRMSIVDAIERDGFLVLDDVYDVSFMEVEVND